MPEDQPPTIATVTQAGPFDVLLDEDFSEDFLDDDEPDVSAVPEALSFDEDVDDDDFVDADDDDDAALIGPADDATDDRIAKLEAAARSLAAAHVERENRRVKRKVAASTTGAGASGLIPLVLQLCGVYHLDPELTAALSTVASLIGAFAAGWVTPERTPALPSDALTALTADSTP